MREQGRTLPLLDKPSGAGSDACCEACGARDRALEKGRAASGHRSPGVSAAARPRPLAGRETDRRITFVGLGLAAVFIGLALVTALLPGSIRRGAWLPLHLTLAGGASVAIGSVLPFFVAALAMARPAPAPGRLAVIGLLSGGALGVAVGVATGLSPLAVAGGLGFIAGLLGLAALTAVILRGALGASRGIHAAIHWLALGQVAAGACLATLFVAGWAPVVGSWDSVKPAHAWLNLFGFLGLVIAATLIHLYPTVLGARIARRRLATVALAVLGAGPLTVALGYLLATDLVARVGALAALGGVVALEIELVRTRRTRGRWTSDLAWHRLTTRSLGAAAGWYGIAVGVAAGRTLVFGATPAGWSLETVGAPLALGFVVQSLTGAWTHLLPAIGPGDPGRHASQRRILATAADLRFTGFNAGTALLALGLPLHLPELASAGAALAGLALSGSLALFARAVLGGRDPSAEPAWQARQAGA